ncbi:MAG: hypothetical protein JNK91_08370 [Ferruginibacter sp.]|nr:hypothetical protein [Ferruginibacter sp.]
MSLSHLYRFLNTVRIIKYREQWLDDYTGPNDRIVDREKGIVHCLSTDEYGNVVDFTASFVSQWQVDLQKLIEGTADEINTIKYKTGQSDQQVNLNLSRIISTLENKANKIDSELLFDPGLERLRVFIESIRNQKIPRKLALTKENTFKGYEITYPGIDKIKFIKSLFAWLVDKGKLRKESESAFSDFLKMNLQDNTAILWHGTPAEFVGFYYSLCNPIDLITPPIRVIYHKTNAPTQILKCFTISGHKGITAKELRKIRSNPLKDSFYNQIASKILELIESLEKEYVKMAN